MNASLKVMGSMVAACSVAMIFLAIFVSTANPPLHITLERVSEIRMEGIGFAVILFLIAMAAFRASEE